MTDPRTIAADIETAARAIRGSSWPGEMAQQMEERANRLLTHAANLTSEPDSADLLAHIAELEDLIESSLPLCPDCHARIGMGRDWHGAAFVSGGATDCPNLGLNMVQMLSRFDDVIRPAPPSAEEGGR